MLIPEQSLKGKNSVSSVLIMTVNVAKKTEKSFEIYLQHHLQDVGKQLLKSDLAPPAVLSMSTIDQH